MKQIDPNTRIIDLTVGELMELLNTIKPTPQEAPKMPKKGSFTALPVLLNYSIAV